MVAKMAKDTVCKRPRRPKVRSPFSVRLSSLIIIFVMDHSGGVDVVVSVFAFPEF
jgi:hypothetical protein